MATPTNGQGHIANYLDNPDETIYEEIVVDPFIPSSTSKNPPGSFISSRHKKEEYLEKIRKWTKRPVTKGMRVGGAEQPISPRHITPGNLRSGQYGPEKRHPFFGAGSMPVLVGSVDGEGGSVLEILGGYCSDASVVELVRKSGLGRDIVLVHPVGREFSFPHSCVVRH
jgi:hypothetical protein